MKFTDIFIHRPVLAMVVSLLILVVGLRSLASLQVLQYPKTENAEVTVSTTYYGADNQTVAGFITTPLENSIAQANGIDYMTSTSQDGVSTITIYLRLNYNPDKALTEISAKVSAVRNKLPPQAQEPQISLQIGQTIDAMYIGFKSKILAPNQITDYLTRVVQPQLQAVNGVQTAEILGGKDFALRAWLDPNKMAAFGVTGSDVSQALANNDYIAGLGRTKGQMVQNNLTASTNLSTLKDFRNLIVKQNNGSVVRLRNIANVVLGAGAGEYDTQVSFDGQKAVYIGIQVAPTANLLDVIKRVKTKLPVIFSQLPHGLQGAVAYDSTKFVNSSIHDVETTLAEALVIVILVIFSFLGAPRSVLIPVVAIPLSLVGAFAMMLIFGFSINLLTLLALVLAIGLVVDDAIIVVENVSRHLEEGVRPLQAALVGARELGGPIIAMAVVLVAVYIPIGFQGGLTGALFTEFAFTLVGAVAISALVALTLSPMLCSRLLKPHPEVRRWERVTVEFIDRGFSVLHRIYSRTLHASLDTRPVVYTFAIIVLGSIYFLYAGAKTELAPQEDQGIILANETSAPNATLTQRQLYAGQVYKILSEFPEAAHIFQIDSPTRAITGMNLKTWNQRKLTSNQLQPIVQRALNRVSGQQIAVFQLPSLPGARGLPIQFIIGTTHSYRKLYGVAERFLLNARKSGRFMFLQSDLKIDQPQDSVIINRNKAALLGLTMHDIGSALASMLGGGYVNYFDLDGRSYQVIPQVMQRYRLNPQQLKNYYINTANGQSIPVSTVATIRSQVIPESINHFQQLNAATIEGVAMPGVSTGEALLTLRRLAAHDLPPGYTINTAGPLREYVQEASGFLPTFGFALIIIFLVLAALFESFRDPLVILVSVPMSIAGALIFISLGVGGATLNIYTEVGLVTLLGLISKHGILIVEFANNLQSEGRSKREAIEEAAGIRLRPILMTTSAMVLGAFPLIIATGAGAEARFNMGLVIASGLAIGTLFTLFVLPAVYMLVAKDRHKGGAGAILGETP